MAFSSNPLSLSVPESAFESWLRDSGYLEVLDQRTTQLHRINSAAAAENHRPMTSASKATGATNSASAVPHTTVTAITYGLIMSIVSSLATLLSLLTVNPLSKLTADDFSGQTPSWTLGFVGSLDSYSFPSSPSQAKMRVHENVKRFARNYASLFILFFACTLYQMPLALVGLISCLAIWDLFRFCSDKWLYARFPVLQQVLVRVMQCASAVILLFSNLQMAIFCAISVGYAGMILHASFRKLTPPAKQSLPAKKWRR
ncbi:hypothetical protein V2J09_007288 [Rumex salicifolius]